jgi:hypothetical protein
MPRRSRDRLRRLTLLTPSCGGPRADREEKRVTHGRDMNANATAMRYVTEFKAMPRGRKPDGDHVLSNAERQARYRACRLAQPTPVVTRTRRPSDPRLKSAGRSRPQRWRDAVIELLTLQAEYADWLTALPDSLRDSATADALEAVVDLNLTTLAETELPRGYGRD